MKNVDLPTVKELLGHASITTTMKYAHPSPAHRKTAVDLLVEEETSRSTSRRGFDPDVEKTQVVEKTGAGVRIRTVDLLITSELVAILTTPLSSHNLRNCLWLA